MGQADLVMGVDIGGTGVKAALVDTAAGTTTTERLRIETPQPATPDAIIGAIVELQKQLKWQGPVGCGFPGLVKGGIVHRAPHLDPSWSGHELINDLRSRLGVDQVGAGNDADAAGLAEMRFGAGQGQPGTVVMITLGTGIGCAMFRDGLLIPDTELGHIEMDGKDAELQASNSAREIHGWKWKKWGKKVDRYLAKLEYLLGVDLYLIGGGVSKKWDKFSACLTSVTCKVVPAQMENLAGIVGAALFALPDGHRVPVVQQNGHANAGRKPKVKA
ncbi:MAG: polyphosphate--glucose phosphotransferase [Candidatus Xenobia bacterium]